MNKVPSTNPKIAEVLNAKAVVHLQITDRSREAFLLLKRLLKQTQHDIKNDTTIKDIRLYPVITEKGSYEIEFCIASDTLIFILHTNVFIFDNDHSIRKTSYLEDNPMNAHCGMISVYNFLSDSFTYNRVNDLGYLIARIFINHENHYFVEGKRQLGFLFNDFENELVTEEKLKSIIDTAILYCLEFDMYIPPFDTMNEISVQEVISASLANSVATGKRLGFKLQADEDKII